MAKQLGRSGPKYDIRAHQELAKAFPALAERLKPLLLTEIEIECPHGHKLRVMAQLIDAGRAVFCPECRIAFKPLLHPEVEVPEAFHVAPPLEGAPPNVRHPDEGNLAREGLARVAEGAGLLMRAAGGHLFGRRSLSGRLLRRVGGWATSGVVHAAILLLAMVFGVRLGPPPAEPELPIEALVTPENQKELYEERLKKRDVFSKIHENVQPVEVLLPDLPDARPPDPVEEIVEEDIKASPGKPLPRMEISDIPLDALNLAPAGTRGVIGLGATTKPGGYALRGDKGARLKAARRGGGGPDTESAVERALAWLYRNQEKAGYWTLNGKTGLNGRAGWWATRGKGMRPAMTAFAALAFLGAGYTYKGGHKYSSTVKKGLEWLIAEQAADGSFVGRTRKCGYAQGVVTLALCEAYAMGGAYSKQKTDLGRRLRVAAQKGLDYIARSQNSYAGWDYSPRAGTSDTSITVWNCMALKAGRLAGLKVDGSCFQGITNWLNSAQDLKTGAGSGSQWTGGAFGYRGRPGRSVRPRGRSVTVMHPAGLMMRLMTGTSPHRREAFGTANLLLTHIPDRDKKKVSDDQLKQLVEAFIFKNYMRWEHMSAEERETARINAKATVTGYPRTVDDFVRKYYAAQWPRATEGQRAVLRETARRAIAAMPKTVDDYINKNYNPWKTFSQEQRARYRAYARNEIKKKLYGKAFPRSIYFLYHSSLAMFQMGGSRWKAWNPQMKRVLLEDQVLKGSDDGAWKPSNGYGMCACVGKTMSTALGAMTLEVYYRYLRIYEK